MAPSPPPTGVVVIRVWLTSREPLSFVAGFTVRDDVFQTDADRDLEPAATIPDVLTRVETWLRAWLADT